MQTLRTCYRYCFFACVIPGNILSVSSTFDGVYVCVYAQAVKVKGTRRKQESTPKRHLKTVHRTAYGTPEQKLNREAGRYPSIGNALASVPVYLHMYETASTDAGYDHCRFSKRISLCCTTCEMAECSLSCTNERRIAQACTPTLCCM